MWRTGGVGESVSVEGAEAMKDGDYDGEACGGGGGVLGREGSGDGIDAHPPSPSRSKCQ